MQRIIQFIEKYKEYFTFSALVIISLSLISIGDVSRFSGFRASVIGTVGWMQNFFSWIPNTGAIKSENRALRELNLQLSSEVTKIHNAINENIQLRQLLALRETGDYNYITADVVGKSIIELRSYITLNKGDKEGLKMSMPVRNDAGLIGTVVATSRNYSLIELINNRDVKIAAKAQRSSVDGILAWDGDRYFMFKNVPKSFDIDVNDTIISSNFSNKYPPLIPIGRVVEKKDLPGDIFSRIKVKPFVNFATLEQVFVIDFLPDPERVKLINELEARIKARAGK